MIDQQVPRSKPLFQPKIARWRFACLLIAAIALRFICAANGIWMDEIWSIYLIKLNKVSSLLDIFSKIHHDNNHYLNTAWLYICGANNDPIIFRSVSIVAGIASVIVSGLIAKRKGLACVLFTTTLTAFSYTLIVYSSEARGYGTAIFFSLLLCFLQESYLDNKSWRTAAAISATIICGLLSHLTFVFVFLASAASLTFKYGHSRYSLKVFLKEAFACYASPLALLVILYFVDISHQTTGGAPASTSPGYAYLNGLAWATGTLTDKWCIVAVSTIAAVIAAIYTYHAWRENPAFSIFLAGGIFVFPLAISLIYGNGYFYPRYFIVGACYLLIVFGRVLAAWHQSNGHRRPLAYIALGIYLLLNGLNIQKLVRYGRGDYQAAVAFLTNNSKSPMPTVGGNKFRPVFLVFSYYSQLNPTAKPITYCPLNPLPLGGVEWVIWQSESINPTTPPSLTLLYGDNVKYRWVESFPSAPLSGLHWFIYRRQD